MCRTTRLEWEDRFQFQLLLSRGTTDGVWWARERIVSSPTRKRILPSSTFHTAYRTMGLRHWQDVLYSTTWFSNNRITHPRHYSYNRHDRNYHYPSNTYWSHETHPPRCDRGTILLARRRTRRRHPNHHKRKATRHACCMIHKINFRNRLLLLKYLIQRL